MKSRVERSVFRTCCSSLVLMFCTHHGLSSEPTSQMSFPGWSSHLQRRSQEIRGENAVLRVDASTVRLLEPPANGSAEDAQGRYVAPSPENIGGDRVSLFHQGGHPDRARSSWWPSWFRPRSDNKAQAISGPVGRTSQPQFPAYGQGVNGPIPSEAGRPTQVDLQRPVGSTQIHTAPPLPPAYYAPNTYHGEAQRAWSNLSPPMMTSEWPAQLQHFPFMISQPSAWHIPGDSRAIYSWGRLSTPEPATQGGWNERP